MGDVVERMGPLDVGRDAVPPQPLEIAPFARFADSRATTHAAHIKKRAVCSDDERRDLDNIAMPTCLLGCDILRAVPLGGSRSTDRERTAGSAALRQRCQSSPLHQSTLLGVSMWRWLQVSVM